MLNEAFGTDVFGVVLTCQADFFAPLEWLDWLGFFQKLDSFLNCFFALLGSERDLSRSLEE